MRVGIENAILYALIRLEDNDLDGELQEDLKFVLSWTRDNMENGKIKRMPNELERKELIEKMLYLLLRTNRN